MNRDLRLRHAAPLAVLSASVLLLAACAGPADSGGTDESAAASGCIEVQSGGASDAVEVTGAFGSEPEATFSKPLETETTERTVLDKGDGEMTARGDTVTARMSVFGGTSGDRAISEELTLVVGDTAAPEALILGVDCVPIGSRIVTAVPGAELFGDAGNASIGIEAGETVVIVTDVIEIVQLPEPGEWTENVPEVSFDDAGLPTVTIPAVDAPTELLVAVLEEGDGATVAEGDTVTLDYQGVKWSDGTVFDQSYGAQPATFATNQVIQGFGAALVDQNVGTRLIVTIPPELGYGAAPSESNPLAGETLVFLIEIRDTASSR